ncbi:hypothetical protein LNV09_11970 [Paucibacter sp. B2R-40]|uniref:hypothetical protein n=1 Tax=Paucibacter sp. B2R-40 TaxID=2893554 RepID=UPI0021E3AE94|nr:hypothetical protein [Paucibacter sp. B2R-40]MCV2354873.1 hypothetical protein [Paucibacter sp. B2R-40]
MRRFLANRLAFATALIAIPMSSLIAPARAQAQTMQSAQQCRAVAEPQARLLCYDAWVDAQAAAKTPPTPSSAKSATAAPAAASFGLEQAAPKAEIQEVDSEIQGLFQGWGPKQVITLANGQRWQIVDGSSATLYLQNPKVKIRRALFGSYALELEGSNHSAKVRRLEP